MIRGTRKELLRMKCTNFIEKSDVIAIQFKKSIFWRGTSIIPKLIILKQQNREYDVDHNLLIKDINNIMLKQT